MGPIYFLATDQFHFHQPGVRPRRLGFSSWNRGLGGSGESGLCERLRDIEVFTPRQALLLRFRRRERTTRSRTTAYAEAAREEAAREEAPKAVSLDQKTSESQRPCIIAPT